MALQKTHQQKDCHKNKKKKKKKTKMKKKKKKKLIRAENERLAGSSWVIIWNILESQAKGIYLGEN